MDRRISSGLRRGTASAPPRRAALGIAGALTLALALGAGPARAEAPAVAGQLVVGFERGADAGERARAHERAGARRVRAIRALDVELVRTRAGGERRALERYRRMGAVRFAEQDLVRRAHADDCRVEAGCARPDDPYFAYQWGLQNDALTAHVGAVHVHDADVDAPWAWSRATARGVRIAVLDTGVDLDHADLSVVASARFVRSKTDDDLYGHGTHVAGIAAATASNGAGVAGAGRDAAVLSAKVLDDRGSGSCSSVADGVAWAVERGAHVVNLSLGSPYPCEVERSAMAYADRHGVLVVAAAGNSGAAQADYPARHASVVGVAATDQADRRASWSSYGEGVELAAPGVDVLSTLPNHRNRLKTTDYGWMDGTSMAAPHVAGAAALAWSVTPDANGDGRRSDDVRLRLERFADPIAGTGSLWSAGRVNACNAVAGSGSACPPH